MVREPLMCKPVRKESAMKGLAGVVTIVSVAMIMAACSPAVFVHADKTAEPLPENCSPVFLELGTPVPANAFRIAEVYVGDSGFSINCGKDNAREAVRKQACKAGADIVSIVSVSEPNFLSDCYRIKAQLYKTVQPSPVPAAMPASQNKIQRLTELQQLREKGAITEEEFQRLKREVIKLDQ